MKLTSNYTTMSNKIIQHDSISLDAKAIYFYMASLPDNWDFSVERIAYCLNITEARSRKYVNELIDFGLLQRVFYHNACGNRKSIYILYDLETMSNKMTDDEAIEFFHNLGNPTLGNRKVGYIYNKKNKENKKINTQNAHASAREGGGVDFANALPLRANANPSLQAEQALPKELKRPPSHINIAKQTSYARFCAQLGKPYDSEQESAFNEFWGLYPRKSNEIKAVEAFLNALGRGVNINTLQEQLKRFKTLLKHKSTPIDKIPFASTWLDSERYNDDLESELAQFNAPAREIEITPEQVWKRAMSELPEPSAEFTHDQLASQPAILRSYKGQKLYAGAKMHTIIGLGLGKANNKAGYVIEVTLRDERDCEVTFRFHAKNQLDFFINNYKI